MAYVQSGLIAATDYNNLAWGGTQGVYTAVTKNAAYVMGVGSGNVGYGQDVSAINTVGAVVVSAVQWAGLLTTVNRALGHQSGAGAQLSVPTITAGGVITYSNILKTAVTTINTNTALATATGSTLTGTAGTMSRAVVGTAASSSFIDTNVLFSSAQAARYFFNAGGRINFYCSAVSVNGTARSASSAAAVNSIGGLLSFGQLTNGGRIGTTGNATNANLNIGYRTSTVGVPVTVVTSAESLPYGYGAGGGADSVLLQIFTNDVDTTNGANGASIAFRLSVTSRADAGFDDAYSVTTTVRADIVYPSSTYLTTNSWGTPTIVYDNA
jgi:hypothetical protein